MSGPHTPLSLSQQNTDTSYVVCSLIGGIVRKLTFVTAYTIGLYIHFFINLGVAAYLLSVILHATRADTVTLCQHALTNAQSQNQCDSLFDTIRGVYAALASFILIVELCESIRLTSLVIKSHSPLPLPSFTRTKPTKTKK